MRVWTIIATLGIASFTAMTAPAVRAQDASGQRMTIAVVDIGYILKNHPTMKNQMESIQSSMEKADKDMSEKRDAIVKQMEQLREQFTEGTPEYDRAEKTIAEQDTEFRLELVKKRKEFELQQATVLFQIHNEITALVKYASEQMGTQLVLRVNREKMDPKRPETVQMVMSQDVLYFNDKVDLTQWVLDGLKQRAASATGATQR